MDAHLRARDSAAVQAIVQTLALDGVGNDTQTEHTGAEAAAGRVGAMCHSHGCHEGEMRDRTPTAVDASSLLLEVEMLLQQSPCPRVPEYSRACGAFIEAPEVSPRLRDVLSGQPSHLPPSVVAATAVEARLQEARQTERPPAASINAGMVRGVQMPSGALALPGRWQLRDDHHRRPTQQERPEVEVEAAMLASKTGCGIPSSFCLSSRSNGGRSNADANRDAPKVAFSECSATTSVVRLDVPQPDSHPRPQPAVPFQLPSAVDDAESIRDNLLCLKEARRLCRKRLMPPPDSPLHEPPPSSFCKRIDLLRTLHRNTHDALNEAMQLLLQERKWLTMRCTILYDRMQQIHRHRARLEHRLQEVYGDWQTPMVSKV